MQKITLIVAASTNNVIGKNNSLPWHLPKDLAYFKAITTGDAIIMGRKTYESIGKPLPNRKNIVITNNTNYKAEGITIAHNLSTAINKAKQLLPKNESIHIIGGATLFKQALSIIDTIYLNRIQTEIIGDTFLPDIDWSQWQLINKSHSKSDDKNNHDINFEVYTRNNPK